MSESKRWIVKCVDTKDGSGDVLVELPQELLTVLGLGVGDELAICVTNDAIVLKPAHRTAPGRSMSARVLRDDTYHIYRLRLQEFLDLPLDASDQDIHCRIEAGFSAILVKALSDTGTMSPEDRDRIVPLKTLKAKLVNDQCLSAEESDRLFRFVHIHALAAVIFGNAEKAEHWLSTPKPRFLGKSPKAMLATSLGTQQVEQMLVQIDEGVVVLKTPHTPSILRD